MNEMRKLNNLNMFRITKTIFTCKDGSTEYSNNVVDVHDLEEYRAHLKGSKYAKVNFIYSEINDNRENSEDSHPSPAEQSGEKE